MRQISKTSIDLAAQADPCAETEVYVPDNNVKGSTEHPGASEQLWEQSGQCSPHLRAGQLDTFFFPSEERVLFRRSGKCFLRKRFCSVTAGL